MNKNSNKNTDLKIVDEEKKLDPEVINKSLRIAPSKRAIFNLPKFLLLKHNALIFHKASSLSSAQRKLIQNRIGYGIEKGVIKPEEVAKEINLLNRMIQGELVKSATKNGDSEVNEQ